MTSSNRPDLIDWSIFNEIMAMDEDEDSFSSNLFLNFCDQAESTFLKIDQAIKALDLKALSDLGHYLKGSAGSLGLIKIQRSCESIQDFGSRRGGEDNWDDQKYINAIAEILQRVQTEFAETKDFMSGFLGIESSH